MPAYYFTYNASLLSPLDRVRFALGDTDKDAALLENATIAAALMQAATSSSGATISSQPVVERRATLELARGLLARYAQEPDSVKTADGTQASFKNRLTSWQSLITRLEAQGVDAPDSAPTGLRVLHPTRGTRARRGEFG